MRPEISEFKRISESLLDGLHQNGWSLTDKERKVVAHYLEELEKNVLPAPTDDQPLAMPLGALPPVID
jgi:hypothetical protein